MKKLILLAYFLFHFANLFPQESIWLPLWNNNYNGWIGGWHIDGSDKYIPGNFILGGDFKNKTEILCINGYNGWASTQRYLGQNGWYSDWNNGGDCYLSDWHISSNDVYVPMHTIYGEGTSSFLAINHSNGWAMVLRLINSPYWHWVTEWGNSQNGYISGWHLDAADQYRSGNFEGTNNDEELLLLNPNSQWAALLRCNSYSWTDLWTNGGSGNISGWIIRNDDIYLTGDVDNCGKSELICVNRSTRWASVFKYQDNNWVCIWSNGGNYNAGLGGWVFFGNIDILINDFNKDGKEDILCISKDNNWATLKNFDVNNLYWPDLFCNYGNAWIGGWHIGLYDRYLAGRFWLYERTFMGVNCSNGYSSLQKYNNGSSPINQDKLYSNDLKFELFQNYPNPFNLETKINFTIQKTGNVDLIIYDLVGREIKTLINKYMEPGKYVINWNGRNNLDQTVSSGIYFMKLISGEKISSKRLIIVK
jgi:hypothetical protein